MLLPKIFKKVLSLFGCNLLIYNVLLLVFL